MTRKFEPYGLDAVFGQWAAGGTRPLTMKDGTVVEPLFLYREPGAVDRQYVEIIGDVFHEIVCEGIYDEGIQWAEMSVVRFNMVAMHPTLGDIVVSTDATRSGTRAVLRSVNPNAKFPVVHRTRMHILMTASALPGVVLQNHGLPLFIQSDHLDQWPPADCLYRLNFQVPLERRDRPGEIVFTINPGAMRVGKIA